MTARHSRRATWAATHGTAVDSTLLKGLHLLEVLIASDDPRGVSELAAQLGLARSNVHRVLKTLEAAGYVRHATGANTYVPTLKVWELGTKVHGRLNIAKEARPFIEALMLRTNETVHLSVLDDAEVVYIDKVESPEPVRAYSTLGGRAPAYCVATGKVLLAYSGREPAYGPDGSLPGFTPRTLTRREDLAAALAEVRTRGYSINWGEWREQVRGVAAPIRDARGMVVAAIGLSGPAERFGKARLGEMIPLVLATADRISAHLGAPIAPEGQAPSQVKERAPGRAKSPAGTQENPAAGRTKTKSADKAKG